MDLILIRPLISPGVMTCNTQNFPQNCNNNKNNKRKILPQGWYLQNIYKKELLTIYVIMGVPYSARGDTVLGQL
jgi:hypothetical protein